MERGRPVMECATNEHLQILKDEQNEKNKNNFDA